MEDKLRLGVKMCGNCNPEIELMRVASRIAAGVGAQLVPYEEGEYVLAISACPSACLEGRYPSQIWIAGLSLNGYPCPNEDILVLRAIEQLRQQIKHA